MKSMKLTVILRNDAPMIHCGDCPAYRSVQVVLTREQCTAIAPRKTGSSGGIDEYEDISRAFIEQIEEAAPAHNWMKPENYPSCMVKCSTAKPHCDRAFVRCTAIGRPAKQGEGEG